MPTFRNDVKLGTKVPLIKTDDLDDRCVTKEKLSDNITSDMKEEVAESTYEKMKEKFLPLTGGTIEGEDETSADQASTIIAAGVVKSKNIKSNPFGIYKATLDKGIIKVSKLDDSKGSTTETQTISAVCIECESNYAGYTNKTLYSISEEGVKANRFETLDQSEQGLLANDGSIATAISESDIDEMFNR